MKLCERADTYPDITLLPSLANLFKTSLDKLIGMDKINDSERCIVQYVGFLENRHLVYHIPHLATLRGGGFAEGMLG